MFKEVIYSIRYSMFEGKTHVGVKFQSLPGSMVEAVYYIR